MRFNHICLLIFSLFFINNVDSFECLRKFFCCKKGSGTIEESSQTNLDILNEDTVSNPESLQKSFNYYKKKGEDIIKSKSTDKIKQLFANIESLKHLRNIIKTANFENLLKDITEEAQKEINVYRLLTDPNSPVYQEINEGSQESHHQRNISTDSTISGSSLSNSLPSIN